VPAEDNGDDGDVLVVVTMRKKMTMASVMRPAMVVMMWNFFVYALRDDSASVCDVCLHCNGAYALYMMYPRALRAALPL
jgi:hypothetical protein